MIILIDDIDLLLDMYSKEMGYHSMILFDIDKAQCGNWKLFLLNFCVKLIFGQSNQNFSALKSKDSKEEPEEL